MKDRNHIRKQYKKISIHTGKAFDKIQYSFMTRSFNQLGTEGTCLNIIKVIYDKRTTSVILGCKKLKTFLLK